MFYPANFLLNCTFELHYSGANEINNIIYIQTLKYKTATVKVFVIFHHPPLNVLLYQ
jgi:hypothetical protein